MNGGTAGKLTSTEHEEIMTALAGLAEDIKRAYAANDAELYLSAFDKEAIVSMPGIPPVRGHVALRALFESRPELPPGATFKVEPHEIEVLSAGWAYAFGTDTLELANGKKETTTFLVLIRKGPDGWKTFREVLSADQP
ncbi:MAG TPA: nuclear transport factor 2 family protein [Pyrinomonadaceae bacterium]